MILETIAGLLLVGTALASTDYEGKEVVYRGKYSGKCGNDGFYYQNQEAFVICSNGNAYIQPCAPGTRNSDYAQYKAGSTYGYQSFCDINLVDHGYGAKFPVVYGGHPHGHLHGQGYAHGHAHPGAHGVHGVGIHGHGVHGTHGYAAPGFRHGGALYGHGRLPHGIGHAHGHPIGPHGHAGVAYGYHGVGHAHGLVYPNAGRANYAHGAVPYR